MLTLAQALRRSALVALGVVAVPGIAAAQAPDDTQPKAQCPRDMATGEELCPPAEAEALPAPAPGQEEEVDVYVEPTYTPPPPADTDTSGTLEQYGIAVSLGGGVSDFTNSTMRDTTDVGGSWDVNVAFGLRSPIGFEAQYIGSAQSIDALGLDSSTVLVGNGLQGNLRVNILDAAVQPFLFGGLAWRHYDLTNSDFNTSDISDNDDVLEVPMGAGIAWKYRGFLVDARGEYRYASGADMVPSIQDDGTIGSASMSRWGANANIGFAF